jgi:DNA-directed RNA polymerase subunit RPC12/RpoP
MRGSPDLDRHDAKAADRRKKACLFLCPNPTCDTQLVVLPEQARRPVECPTCGFRFIAPEPIPTEGAFASPLPQPVQQESKAADALDALVVDEFPKAPRPASMVGGHQQYAAPPLPTRAELTAEKLGEAFHTTDRRKITRIGVGERLLATTLNRAEGRTRNRAAPAGGSSRAAELVLTWAIAVLASGGITAAGLMGGRPEFALGSILFVGLAVIVTVLMLRRRGRGAA